MIYLPSDAKTLLLGSLAHSLLERTQLHRGEGIGFANHGNNVDTGRETSHEFDVEFAKTVALAGWPVKAFVGDIQRAGRLQRAT
jgi:hypothetical protein